MRLWALVTSALRMMKVSPCVGGCHVRGSPLLPLGRSVPGKVGGNGALLSGSGPFPEGETSRPSACPYQGPGTWGQGPPGWGSE